MLGLVHAVFTVFASKRAARNARKRFVSLALSPKVQGTLHLGSGTRHTDNSRLPTPIPISRYRDKLSATYHGQIAVLKIFDFF